MYKFIPGATCLSSMLYVDHRTVAATGNDKIIGIYDHISDTLICSWNPVPEGAIIVMSAKIGRMMCSDREDNFAYIYSLGTQQYFSMFTATETVFTCPISTAVAKIYVIPEESRFAIVCSEKSGFRVQTFTITDKDVYSSRPFCDQTT